MLKKLTPGLKKVKQKAVKTGFIFMLTKSIKKLVQNCKLYILGAILISFLFIPIFSYSIDLLQAYQLAYKNSPLLKSKKTAYQTKVKNKDIKLGALLPNLSLSATPMRTEIYGNSQLADVTNGGVFEVSANQTIFDYSAINIYRSVSETALSAYANYKYQEQQFMLLVAKTYFKILLNEAQLKISKAKLKTTESLLKKTKKKYQLHLKTLSDLTQIESEYFRVKALLKKNNSDLKNQYLKLNALMVTNHISTISKIKDDNFLQPPRPLNLNKWIKKAIINNHLLKSKKYAEAAAEKAVQACQGRFMPSISLSASYGYNINPFTQPGTNDVYGSSSKNVVDKQIRSSQQVSCLDSTSNNTIPAGSNGLLNSPSQINFVSAAISLTLTWNIFNGGISYAALKQGADEQQQAFYSTLQEKQDVEYKIEKNYLEILANLENIKSLKFAVNASKLAYQADLKKYNKDLIAVNELLQQMDKTFQDEYRLVNAKYSYINNLLNLKLNAGILSENDIRKINLSLE